MGGAFIIFLFSQFRYDMIVPNFVSDVDNLFIDITLSTVIGVMIIDLLLTFYVFFLTNRFMNENQSSMLSLGLFFFLTVLSRMYFYMVIRYELVMAYSDRNPTIIAFSSILFAIILILAPSFVILQSIAYFLIRREILSETQQKRIKFIILLNILFSVFTLFMISLPLVSIFIYNSWNKGYSNVHL